MVVVSGIRPTGSLHLGNYFGAVRNFVKMQHENQCFFFIADWHALTTHPDGKHLQESIRKVLAEYLACGLDPQKATIYLQSDVPEVAELYVLLNMHAYLGELERTTSFKEKVRLQPQNINAGLLTYPVLMTADVIIHKAEKVPVGKDQKQNLEMMRKFTRRFNNIHKTDFFPIPEPYDFSGKMIKVPGLDGSGKMGKSAGNGVFLSEAPESIRKKVMKAVTDSGPTQENQEKSEPIQNIFSLMQIVSSADTYEHFDHQHNTCEIRYGDLKKQLAEDIISFVDPFRKQILENYENRQMLDNVMREGAEKARESASKTLREVRKIMGFRNDLA